MGKMSLVVLVIVGGITPGGSAWADERAPPAADPSVPPCSVGSPQDLGPFLDGVLTTQLAAHRIPGAAVAVVCAGRVLYLAGYGRADLEPGRPVSADHTLFRTASVSKVVTWTAVMQLVERGKLDLHRDVNHYLDFQVPATYPQPITLAHLLTHTPGFEEREFGSYARSAADLLPLGTFLRRNLPARIFPPGEVSAYSNYGAALAGYIVAWISGVAFEDYVERHILKPLGMDHSSFRQPLPPALAAELATGYGRRLRPAGFEWDQDGPAGALSATTADMARLMLAHLPQGRLGAVRILGADTAAAMQRRQHTNHPAVNGLTYGFQELTVSGRRVLAQPGDMLAFTTAMFLLPSEDLGLYVAYNRGGASDAPQELLHLLLARFPPAPPPLPSILAPRPDPDTGRFAGSYRSTRRNETGLEKLQELFNPVRVRALGSSALAISGLAVVPRGIWRETGPGIFRDRSGEVVAFREDRAGRPAYLFEGNFPAAGYSRLPWYGAPEVHYALLALCLPVFLLSPAVWSVGALRRRRAGARLSSQRRGHWSAAAMCAVNLLFLAGIVVVIAHGRELLFGVTPLARGVLLLPLLSAGLAALTSASAIAAWAQGRWNLWGRLHYTLVALLGLAFLASLAYWNLLRFRL
jgi:CubicO group peptidase (beta-lactamase class C family)